MSRPAGRSGRVVTLACLSAAVATTGVQGIAPVLPVVQSALDISDAQLALLTTVYLLPSVLVGIPVGLLSDRVGRRPVMCAALMVFGLGGLALLRWHDLAALLAIRVVQGAAFGVVLALTITVIGDMVSEQRAQVRAQGHRIVAMTVGEAVFPPTAGLLVSVAWFAPLALPALAIPLALAAWWVVPSTRSQAGLRPSLRSVAGTLRDPGVLGLQALAFLRFLLKFTVLTFYPVIAVREIGLSVPMTGAAIGAASVLGAVAAASAGILPARVLLTTVMAVSLLGEAVALVSIGSTDERSVAVLAVLVFGCADGMLAVALNALITRVAPEGMRAGFVALTGTSRNLGKLAAPMASGVLAIVLPLGVVFLVMAGVGAAVATATWPVRKMELASRSDDAGT